MLREAPTKPPFFVSESQVSEANNLRVTIGALKFAGRSKTPIHARVKMRNWLVELSNSLRLLETIPEANTLKGTIGDEG